MTRYHVAINRRDNYSHARSCTHVSLPSLSLFTWSGRLARTESDFLRRRFLPPRHRRYPHLGVRGKVAHACTQSESLNVDACNLHRDASPFRPVRRGKMDDRACSPGRGACNYFYVLEKEWWRDVRSLTSFVRQNLRLFQDNVGIYLRWKFWDIKWAMK